MAMDRPPQTGAGEIQRNPAVFRNNRYSERGMPAPGAETVTFAVNVTLCVAMDGLRLEPRLVVVAAALTVCVILGAVLAKKAASPP